MARPALSAPRPSPPFVCRSLFSSQLDVLYELRDSEITGASYYPCNLCPELLSSQSHGATWAGIAPRDPTADMETNFEDEEWSARERLETRGKFSSPI